MVQAPLPKSDVNQAWPFQIVVPWRFGLDVVDVRAWKTKSTYYEASWTRSLT